MQQVNVLIWGGLLLGYEAAFAGFVSCLPLGLKEDTMNLE
jgi:hypothetical protein